MTLNRITSQIIGSAIEVHRTLGPGLLERTYEACLCHELQLRHIDFHHQKRLPVDYKGKRLTIGYRLDLLVAEQVVVELKTVDTLLPIHSAQVLTYLRLGRFPVGLLLNFKVPLLRKLSRISPTALCSSSNKSPRYDRQSTTTLKVTPTSKPLTRS